MQKKYMLFIIMIFSILLFGCKNQNNQLENSVTINSSISGYSLSMSSVPGLPLDIKVSSDEKHTKLGIKVKVEKGDLLNWEGAKVSNLGNDVTLDFYDTTMYWSPLTSDSMTENNEVQLTISIIDIDTKAILDSETYIIEGKNGLYNLKNKPLTEEK